MRNWVARVSRAREAVEAFWVMSSRPRRWGAVLSGVLLVALVVGAARLVVRPPQPPAAGSSTVLAPDTRRAAATAVVFLEGAWTADPQERHRAIRTWATPSRTTELLAAFDASPARRLPRGRHLRPEGLRVDFDQAGVVELLLWTRAPTGPSPDDVTWRVSAVGVHLVGGQWRVFSYEGTRDGVRPGDPRLRRFLPFSAVSGRPGEVTA